MPSSSAFEIAPARADHVEKILDVVTAVAAEGRWIATELPFDRKARSDKLHAAIANDDVFVCVALAGEAVVGELSLFPGAWPGVVEAGMVVAPEWRSRGVGMALMKAAIAWARGRAHKIALHVYPHNDAAIALYERCGFQREGYLRSQHRRRNGELWDALAMGLLL